jgi:hypothetical protein
VVRLIANPDPDYRTKSKVEKLPKKGLVIYHMDEYVKFHKNPGFFGLVGWPENDNHYRVAIMQSNSKYN